MTTPMSGTGISAQFGIGTETTFGSAVTVDSFLEFTSETLNKEKNVVVGQGLRAGGLLPLSQRRVITTSGATGTVTMNLPTMGLATLLHHCTGTAASPFILADTAGLSATVEVGVPQYDGTVVSKKIAGAKVTQFELGVDQAGIATGTFTFDGKTFTMSGAPALASYDASSVFHFAQGTMSFDGGTAAYVKSFQLTVANTNKTDRYGLDGTGTKAEQIIGGFRVITGSLTAEFANTDMVDKFLSDAEGSLSLVFHGESASLFQIDLSAVKFDGEAPQVSGPQPVDVNMTFSAYFNGTDEPLTITYTEAGA